MTVPAGSLMGGNHEASISKWRRSKALEKDAAQSSGPAGTAARSEEKTKSFWPDRAKEYWPRKIIWKREKRESEAGQVKY